MSKKFVVSIELLPEDPNKLLKIIRSISKISLKDAVDIKNYIVSNLPCPIVSGIDKENAEFIANKLLEAGAKIKLSETEILHPMVLSPNAKNLYDFSFWGIKKHS